jgi:putative nucleotidyltransferase with HDIG domain
LREIRHSLDIDASREGLLASLLESIRACRTERYALWDHSIAVASTARRLAVAMSLPRHHQRLAYLGGLLHDVGKTETCGAALFKPGPLTADERKVMNLHPVVGAGLVRELGVEAVTHAVHFHHELFDGTGYPLGLRGDEIPLVARIVAVADYYEALCESRPYRPVALTHEAALVHITLLAGERKLDPAACSALAHAGVARAPAHSRDFERAAQFFELTF